MSRRWKIAIGAVIALLALLSLNAIVLNAQTDDAETTVEGSQLIEASGGDLQVTDSGNREGSPVVLLHCYTCSLRYWDRLGPLLEPDHRVIRIDLLGHGGSDKPKSGYSIEEQAATVASALASLGVTKATVVGHSLGFTIAVGLAERSPELVGKLVNLDQAPNNEEYGDFPLIAKLAYMPLVGQALNRTLPDFMLRDSLREELFAPGFSLANGFEDPDQIVEDFRAMTYTSFKESGQAEDDFTKERSLDERLMGLGIPLLVAFGAEDQVYDAEEAADAYRDLPGAGISIVEGAGHSPNVEKPEETAALILEFAASPGDEGTPPSQQEFVPPNKGTVPPKKKRGG